MKNRLWEIEWRKSRLPGDCNPVVWGDDIVLHDGAGGGLGDVRDEIGYYETLLTGDFELSCKLLESERAYYGTAISTGIMLRAGVDGGDAMIYFGLQSDGEYHITCRAEKGDASEDISVPRYSQTTHRYMKLARVRDNIVCSVSRDGKTYDTVADLGFALPETVHVGFTSAFKSVYGGVVLR